MIPWDDKRLFPADRSPLARKYRRHQSWYRQERLGVEPGTYMGRDGVERLNGALLHVDAVADDPTLNFLGQDDVASYSIERAHLVGGQGGQANIERLKHNLLSSMPLCFNIFGWLRGRTEIAARVLTAVTGLDVATVELIECEWAPLPKVDYLNDSTAFDANVEYRTTSGERGFLAVETKYTEPLSTTVYPVDGYPKPRYREVTEDPASGFKPGAYEHMLDKRVNQLWRNLMLAIAHQRAAGFEHAHLVLLALAEDTHADEAARILSDNLVNPPSRLRRLTLERLVDALSHIVESAGHATLLRDRYLIGEHDE